MSKRPYSFLSLFLLLIAVSSAKAQRIDIDLFGGLSNYQGDLQPAVFTLQQSHVAGSAVVKYKVTNHIYARAGVMIGKISGDDFDNKSYLSGRNLRFQSRLQEFHIGAEYRFIKESNFMVTPYLFLAPGIYHYNPYTYYNGNKVYFQPLGTEGQGLPEYPNKKLYDLTQFCMIYGGGFKFNLNCNMNVGVEVAQRKLFTDYLDDASGTFADEAILRNARGQMAVDLAYPSRLIDPNATYPHAGDLRANPKLNDWYYSIAVTVGLRLFDCRTGIFSLGGIFNKKMRRNQETSCPENVW